MQLSYSRKNHRHNIRLPQTEPNALDQDQAFFWLEESGDQRKISFHDYPELYKRPGLYEQLFYERLHCCSPHVVASMLRDAVEEAGEALHAMRVLDLGAGNGMMGEELAKMGVARVIGVDISPEAREACHRDRPGSYDDYMVIDLTHPTPQSETDIRAWSPGVLTCVAALGFGDIPVEAFVTAYNLLPDGAWVAFNLKEHFMRLDGRGGFGPVIRDAIVQEHLALHQLRRYRHRLSIDGQPLHYLAVVGRKHNNLGLGDL